MNWSETALSAVPARWVRFARARRAQRQNREMQSHYTLPWHKLWTRINFETITDCNMRCGFCPQGATQRPSQRMAMEVYTQVVEELARLEYRGSFVLHITNEPLLDDRLPELIALARVKLPSAYIQFFSNGRLATVEMLDHLFAQGLDNLVINDYRGDRAKHPFRLSKNLAEIRDRFAPTKVRIQYRSTEEELTNRAGNVAKPNPVPLPLDWFCFHPFEKMFIAVTGKVVLCDYDYQYGEVMGDVMTQRLDEIWFSPKYDEVRTMLFDCRRSRFICSRCDAPGYMEEGWTPDGRRRH